VIQERKENKEYNQNTIEGRSEPIPMLRVRLSLFKYFTLLSLLCSPNIQNFPALLLLKGKYEAIDLYKC
jgi:hypothetical protein